MTRILKEPYGFEDEKILSLAHPVAAVNLRSAVTQGRCLFSLLYGDEILSSYIGLIS